MKKTYLLLTMIGFIIPNIFVAKVGVETGNILLWTDIPTTFNQMLIMLEMAKPFILPPIIQGLGRFGKNRFLRRKYL